MAQTDTTAAVRRGGRYFRDPQTGTLLTEAEYQKPAPETPEQPDTPVPSTPAKRKGN